MLYYFTVLNAFTDNLKLRNIHFKQIAKTTLTSDYWEEPCRRYLNLYGSFSFDMFLLCCMAGPDAVRIMFSKMTSVK
jgi:hypothetical protein